METSIGWDLRGWEWEEGGVALGVGGEGFWAVGEMRGAAAIL